MTTKYKHRVTLACPESLVPAANQLALISGESSADVSTFSTAGYEDSLGNKFAVCSTVVTDAFLAIQAGLPSEIPAHAESADVVLAQQALDSLQVLEEGTAPVEGKVLMVVGPSAKEALSLMGLSRIPEEV